MGNIKDIETLIRARYPLLYVVTHEEERLLQDLAKLAERRKGKVCTWSITRGFSQVGSQAFSSKDVIVKPMQALESIANGMAAVEEIYIMKDFHEFFTDVGIVRAARDLVTRLRGQKRTVIFVAPVLRLDVGLEKDVHVIDYDLPTKLDIYNLAVAVTGSRNVSSELLDSSVDAATGLTLTEAENAFAKSLAMTSTLEPSVISDEKRQIVKKSGLLEFIHSDGSLDAIGGHEVLKSWLKRRARALTPEAKAYGMETPKGILLVGPPGVGKTFIAKAVANTFKVPHLKLDVGRLFGGLVGETEKNVRLVIKTIEAVAPCVVQVEEMEKAFAGSSGAGDGGTSSRLLASFLDWLQDGQSFAFIVGTANKAKSLPAELIRKGRFDEIWFCDLPNQEERKAIFRLHVTKRVIDDSGINYEELAEKTDGFTGAEIEAIVKAAKWDAFDAHTSESPVYLSQQHLLEQIQEAIPLSIQMAETIGDMREWAKANAKPTSTPGKMADISGGKYHVRQIESN